MTRLWESRDGPPEVVQDGPPTVVQGDDPPEVVQGDDTPVGVQKRYLEGESKQTLTTKHHVQPMGYLSDAWSKRVHPERGQESRAGMQRERETS